MALVVVSDISEAIANECSQQLEKMKTIYYASTAHDLRTPVNSILGSNQLLKAELEAMGGMEKLIYYLDVSTCSCHYLLQIVDGIIDLSKLELNSFTLVKEWINLPSTVQEVLQILQI